MEPAFDPPAGFANYPKAIEGPKSKYEAPETHNPVLRGYPLIVAASLISRFPSLQRWFWNNAGFGTVKDMPELRDVPFMFHPSVTPLGENGPMLELTSDFVATTHKDSKARYYSIADYHELYKSGKVTPLDVAQALIPITKPGGNKKNIYEDAWADNHDNDHLILEAAKASTERWAAGKQLGILDGVPVGVKDDVDIKGWINHFGMKYNASEPFFKRQEKSAWPVKSLQDAGAVVIGKNRMHELGSDTNGLNPSQGTPTNHMNTEYYPGGSSSGPASALGAGVVPVCIGTDAGGSIRIPANFNGIYGLKPTHHRTIEMDSTMCVTGPMAANVADLTIAYRFMAQPNPQCSTQLLFGQSVPPKPSAKRTMGVYRDWWKYADPEVQAECQKALDYFSKEKGYEIIDIEIPCLAKAQLSHGTICVTEMSESARSRTKDPADWLSLVGPNNKISMCVGRHTLAGDYLKFNALRTVLMRHLAFLFQKHPGLLIMTPTTPISGWPKMAADAAYGAHDANMTFKNMMYIFLANMTGTPSISAPVGYAEPKQGKGTLPIGMCVTGEWGSEEQLLAWAGEAEEYLHKGYDGGRRRAETWLDVMDLVKNSKTG